MRLDELFASCKEKHGCCLDKDQFSTMLAMYPAALVAMADGSFDELEKLNLVEALKVSSEGNALVMCETYAELRHLLSHPEESKEVLDCMRQELAEMPEVKLVILELMISTAESEGGISEVEKAKIDELKELLDI